MSRRILPYSLIFILLIVFATSCGTQKGGGGQLYDPKEVAALSRKLGIPLSNVNKDDDKNMPLYAEVSQWLGVRYRNGGLSKKGVDCSGFTFLTYQKVYKKKLPRSSGDMAKMNMQKVSKKNLQTGDLVFFATSKNSSKINHVGIYLKNGCFIHASTSKGVIVSHLDEGYYEKTWKKAGRVR
ncbi:C40 family peptidase [Prevotella sp. 10(H)]|uniref:C40 family peptidase n=1 Tax=Prevotella sp. 10(H) TaxID=1158294 RepID=UPI0004A77CE6|nr:C40 family peptidase [Prevotella sp. 10(H)]